MERTYERCLTSLVIREIQVKTTVRDHFTFTRMAIKNDREWWWYNTNTGKDAEKLEPTNIADGDVKMVQLLWKQRQWQFLKKLGTVTI